jgi:FkbM family methyltransferase
MKTRLFNALRAVARLLMGTRLRYLPGARAAYEFAYGLLVSRDPVAVQCEGSWIYVDPRDVGVSLYLMTEQVYEPQLTELLKRILEPGMTVVDGGANVGYFTLLCARLVGQEGRVYAFEPEPRNFGLLRKSVERNRADNVVLTQGALSDRRGQEKLYLDRSNFGEPSLRQANVTEPVGAVDVETLSLDDFLASQNEPRVDLIKLDTQGAEGLVLAGAARLLDEGAPRIVVMEFAPWGLRNMGTDPLDLLRDLRDRGFDLRVLDERSGRLLRLPDTEIVADCDRRDRGRGFVTLVLER